MKHFFIIAVVAATIAACGSDKKTDSSGNTNVAPVKAGELKIGFFNSDSIPNHFDYHKSETAKLEVEAKKLEAKAAKLQSDYQNLANEYQRGLSTNTLSDNQKMSFENRLGKMQQDMQLFQQNTMGEYQQKELKSTEILMNKIADYSASFAKEKGFSMFFVRGQGSGVAYADPGMDMTDEFIKYMNEKEKELDGKAEGK